MAIDDPTAYFQVKLYNGSGSIQSITFDGNTNMQPDFIWCKSRNNARHHYLADVIRGVKSRLRSDTDNAEYTANSTSGFDSFDSNGFTLEEDSSSLGLNESGHTMVSWNWKAGGSPSSNSNGSITSSVSANTTAGFSIVSYTGNATNGATVGHGLNAVPDMLIGKDLSDGSGWGVWHKGLSSAVHRLSLSTNGTQNSDTHLFGGTGSVLPTSSVFTLGSGGGLNGSNANIVYAFTSIKNFSKCGSYVGNASTSGPFVFTSFKPAWIMVKAIDQAKSWYIWDNKRSTSGSNLVDDQLLADTTDTEFGGANIDILSNGFKFRSSGSGENGSGTNYIYLAFAESPFVTSTGIPTTAR